MKLKLKKNSTKILEDLFFIFYNFQQKQLEFDRIMSSVPSTILAKLPLPQGFEVLPEHIQRKIRKIHGQNDLDWKQKTRKVKINKI